jgi:hypothetical protein
LILTALPYFKAVKLAQMASNLAAAHNQEAQRGTKKVSKVCKGPRTYAEKIKAHQRS